MMMSLGKVSPNLQIGAMAPMVVGAGDQLLTYTSDSAGAVTYSSSDTGLATIIQVGSNYYIHPVAAGSPTITASQVANGNYSAATSPGTATVSGWTSLDAFTNTQAAYSPSKLFSGALKAFQVIRASDGTTLDIGFVGNNLDFASLNAFLASTTGKITKWYDQSGHGNDATETTDANRPAVTLNVQNGLPAFTYDGASSRMTTASFANSSFNQSLTFFTLANKAGTAFRLHDSNQSTIYYASRNNDPNLLYNTDNIGSGATLAIKATPYLQNMDSLLMETYSFNGTVRKLFVQNAQYSSLTTSSANIGLSGAFNIGTLGGSGFWWDGTIFCKIYMNTTLSISQINTVNRKLGYDFGLLEPKSNVLFPGNSLTYGTPFDPSSPNCYPQQLKVLLGGGSNYTFTNQGGIGATTANLTSIYTGPNAYNTNGFAKRNIAVFLEGRNSMTQGETAAQAYADLLTFMDTYPPQAFTRIVLTMQASLVTSVETSLYGTTSASLETQRQLYNPMIIAGLGSGHYEYVVDLGSDPILGNQANCTNPTYFQSDGIHLTAVGYGIIAALVKPVLLPLI